MRRAQRVLLIPPMALLLLCLGAARAAECPDSPSYQTLYVETADGYVPIRGGEFPVQDIARQLNFLYVLDREEGAREQGAILIKRIYAIPDDWGDQPGAVITVRRNRESEWGADSHLYDDFHQDPNLHTVELKRGFHADYGDGARSDDSAGKRQRFRYPSNIVEDTRTIEKPLIVTWDGLGEGKKCVDFNLNEGGGDYKRITVYLYELDAPATVGNDRAPKRVISVDIVPEG